MFPWPLPKMAKIFMSLFFATNMILFCPLVLLADPLRDFPVLYEGRIRPSEAYATEWLKKHPSRSLEKGASALDALWLEEFALSSLLNNQLLVKEVTTLKKQKLSPFAISAAIMRDFPLKPRLEKSGTLFFSLPSRLEKGKWLPLKALEVTVYSPLEDAIGKTANFTLFDDFHFETVRNAYMALKSAYENRDLKAVQEKRNLFGEALIAAYKPLFGTPIYETDHKRLLFPTYFQLKLERIYLNIPWIPILITLLSISAILSLSCWKKFSQSAFWTAFITQTIQLTLYCTILERPPVSNITESLLFVPWIINAASLFKRKDPLIRFSASLSSSFLLILSSLTKDGGGTFNPIHAVLDSQFWLAVHVLLVVTSYGFAILSSLLSHAYLFTFFGKSPAVKLEKNILNSLYLGTFFLLFGTILGGMWAAQSWGRFWDFDPKECWAFISLSIYLATIHAYRHKKIALFGLCIASICGALAVSFTWYGVNYILGSGLHSYGFGVSDSVKSYIGFVTLEILFISLAIRKKVAENKKIAHHPLFLKKD